FFAAAFDPTPGRPGALERERSPTRASSARNLPARSARHYCGEPGPEAQAQRDPPFAERFSAEPKRCESRAAGLGEPRPSEFPVFRACAPRFEGEHGNPQEAAPAAPPRRESPKAESPSRPGRGPAPRRGAARVLEAPG